MNWIIKQAIKISIPRIEEYQSGLEIKSERERYTTENRFDEKIRFHLLLINESLCQ